MRRVVASALLLLAAGSALAAPAPFVKKERPDVERQELQRLQGEWVVSRHEKLYGRRLYVYDSQRSGKRRTAFVTGNSIRWRDNDRGVDDGQAFTLDVRAKPKTINFTCDGSDATARGIYRFDGNALTICLTYLNRALPSSFSLDRPGDELVILRRR